MPFFTFYNSTDLRPMAVNYTEMSQYLKITYRTLETNQVNGTTTYNNASIQPVRPCNGYDFAANPSYFKSIENFNSTLCPGNMSSIKYQNGRYQLMIQFTDESTKNGKIDTVAYLDSFYIEANILEKQANFTRY